MRRNVGNIGKGRISRGSRRIGNRRSRRIVNIVGRRYRRSDVTSLRREAWVEVALMMELEEEEVLLEVLRDGVEVGAVADWAALDTRLLLVEVEELIRTMMVVWDEDGGSLVTFLSLYIVFQGLSTKNTH
jgi:hypothetical protein